MGSILKSLAQLFIAVPLLVACGHLPADASESSSTSKSVRVLEKEGKIAIRKGSKESSFNLFLPKGFEIEKVFKQSHGNYEVISYQYSNGEEAGSQIQVINSKDMKLIWRKEIPGFNLAQPLIKGDAIYVALVDYVAKLDLKSGKVLWKKEGIHSSHEFIGSDEITLKNGVVHFSDKLKIRDSNGQFVGGGK